MNRLNSTHEGILNSADPNMVISALLRLQPVLSTSCWLPTSNRYARNTVNTLKTDSEHNTLVPNDFAEYVAVSALVHCTDGWSYLGRAIAANNVSDPDISRHLAYYAELRAAMSLMAADAIGIFSSEHFVINASNSVVSINRNSGGGLNACGTHKFLWLAFSHWVNSPRCASLMFQALRVGSITFSDWFTSFGAPMTADLAASKSVERWGMDLAALEQDHFNRNTSSYRPTVLHRTGVSPLEQGLEFMTDLWQLTQPTIGNAFEYLDMTLLRDIFRDVYEGVHGSILTNHVHYKSTISRTVNNLVTSSTAAYNLIDFLSDPTSNSSVLSASCLTDDISVPSQNLQVIARAFLLLRLATGACTRLLNNAALHHSIFNFWWDDIGVQRGLWQSRNKPTDYQDLWADIEDASNTVSSWFRTQTPIDVSYASYQKACSSELLALSSCERIALWSLAT